MRFPENSFYSGESRERRKNPLRLGGNSSQTLIAFDSFRARARAFLGLVVPASLWSGGQGIRTSSRNLHGTSRRRVKCEFSERASHPGTLRFGWLDRCAACGWNRSPTSASGYQRTRRGGFITGDGFANYRDRDEITGWHMACAFQKRVGDYLRVRKDPHNAPWNVNDRPRHAGILPYDFREEDRIASAHIRIIPVSWTVLWLRRIGAAWRGAALCALDYFMHFYLMYWIRSIERPATAQIICYIAKERQKGREILTNGRPIALVARMRQRGLFARVEEREVQAFRSSCVQTSVLYDERSGEACPDSKNQRRIAERDHSYRRSRKSCDSGDSSRPFFRVLSEARSRRASPN